MQKLKGIVIFSILSCFIKLIIYIFHYSFLLSLDEAMNTVSALKLENLWSTELRKDVVKMTIDAATKFDRKFGLILSDHHLHFRFLPAIWTPLFLVLKDLDWLELSHAPENDVDRILLTTMIFDCEGYDLVPTPMEQKLGVMLPRKIRDEYLEITEDGPCSLDFNFDISPISEVTKLSVEDAISTDFVALVGDKVPKRNIFKWLYTLLTPKAVLIIGAKTCFERLVKRR